MSMDVSLFMFEFEKNQKHFKKKMSVDPYNSKC